MRFFHGAALIALAVLLPCCTANKKPSSFESAIAHMAQDVAIPVEARRAKNPVPPGPEAVKDGQQVYSQSCALCHGTDGHGNTNLGRAMYPPATDLTSPFVQHWTDAELFWIIQNGIRLTGMPSWKSTIPATDSWKLVQFIRALPGIEAQAASAQSAPVSPNQEQKAQLIAYGRTLYRQEDCFACHQLDGQGGKVGPDLSYEGTRGRTNAWLIGHFKDPPAYTPGSIMLSYKNLTPAQLDALVEFLQSQKGPAK